MPSALEQLRARVGELSDLEALGRLAGWDQRVMMPPAGSQSRAQLLGTLTTLTHERAIADEIGGWLEELEGAELDGVDADLVRVARRDHDRARCVPVELAAELARASSEGQDVWEAAREHSDFGAFAPALRHNVGLARDYAACFAGHASPYDALLADYDFGLTGARIAEVFGGVTGELPALLQEVVARQGPAPAPLVVAPEVQERACETILRRVGVHEEGWRLDVSTHPFTSWVGRGDVRLTTRFTDGNLESVLAALHEFGHGLYEAQIAPELARSNLGLGTSMSAHESQSKLWENHVCRHQAFAGVIAEELGAAGFAIEPEALHRSLTYVQPSLIRVSADQLTYPLHIVLRFELERALIDGTLDVADLPAAWNDGMRRLLGVEVPDDAHGVLQDVHWAAGAFGYFPSYAIGCLMAAQMWEALEADLGSQHDALAAGDLAAVRAWLGEHVHAHGRRLDTEDLVRASTRRDLEAGPFLRHVAG